MSNNQMRYQNVDLANQRPMTVQEDEKKLIKQIDNNVCGSILMIALLCFLIYINDGKTCGIEAEHILYTAMQIKLFFNMPFNILLKCFVVNKKLSASIVRLIMTFFEPICMLYWYFYVTSQFFKSKNQCLKDAPSLYIGLLLILLEAFTCFLILLLI